MVVSRPACPDQRMRDGWTGLDDHPSAATLPSPSLQETRCDGSKEQRRTQIGWP